MHLCPFCNRRTINLLDDDDDDDDDDEVGWGGENGAMEQKRNISETRKDRWKVTVEGL